MYIFKHIVHIYKHSQNMKTSMEKIDKNFSKELLLERDRTRLGEAVLKV